MKDMIKIHATVMFVARDGVTKMHLDLPPFYLNKAELNMPTADAARKVALTILDPLGKDHVTKVVVDWPAEG